MKLYKPASITIFQLFAAWVLVAVITCPGDAFHHGPMLILKGHAGGGNGAMAAAGLVAAGLAIKMLTGIGKGGSQHHHHGGDHHHGGVGGGGGGFGGAGVGGYGGGDLASMMHTFAGHDGYVQEMHGGWMRR